MSVSQYIYKQINNIYDVHYQDSVEVEDNYCYICGGETNNKGLPIKKTLSSNFTNQEFAKNHSSNSICEACIFMIKQDFIYFNPNKNKDSKLKSRNTSWIITPEYTYPKLQKENNIIRLSDIPNPTTIRNFLLKEHPESFVLLYSTSGQKHLFFRSTVINKSKDFFTVVYEEEVINTCYNEFIELLDIVESLMTFGFSKKAIKELNLFSKDFSIKDLKPVIDVLSLYKDNPVLDFVSNIAIKEDKPQWKTYKKMSASMGLTQKIKTTHQQAKSSIPSIGQEIPKSSQQKHQKATGERSKHSVKNQQEGQQQLFDL